ncbi:MAG: hypothetical protein JWN63_618 [Candidatus Acidoferrum typicum]|jgi:hypothetical protein|nr:hypothetical protein [Candidatus Acidoferrum typicum]
MGYIEQNLVPGENVLYKTRLHWIVLVRPLIVGVVLGSRTRGSSTECLS